MSLYPLPNSNTISKLSLLATPTSFVKGDRVYSSGPGIAELLFCKLEPENLFNVHRSALKVVRRTGNEDQIIGHLPDSLTEKIAPLVRQDFNKSGFMFGMLIVLHILGDIFGGLM